jgi:glycine dehydrogenase
MKPNDGMAFAKASGIAALLNNDEFHSRHIGPSAAHETQMLDELGFASRQALIKATIPAAILLDKPLKMIAPCTEMAALKELKAIAQKNELRRNFIGAGYYGTITPEPIRRNLLENPGWYTAYTPYQAEVAQGRLESLMNFQQMVVDLTGLEVANASLLDEATAAAEAMALAARACKTAAKKYFVEQHTHPQVIAVVATRAKWMGFEIVVGQCSVLENTSEEFFGGHFQSPDTLGSVRDYSESIAALHKVGAKACVGSDLLALMLIKTPGQMGADISIGSAQRFGVPLGFGGPHAAFMATRNEFVRMMPGRLIGVSKDARGDIAYRMSLQTREQHIRRDKATSNICTAQALLANIAAFYAIYHGPEGLLRIALRAHMMARLLAQTLGKTTGVKVLQAAYFDTVAIDCDASLIDLVLKRANAQNINIRVQSNCRVSVSFDETSTLNDVADIASLFDGQPPQQAADYVNALAQVMPVESDVLLAGLRRSGAVLTHSVFNRYHSETEFMRYMKRLENKDISLVHSMIALGSCTMKLNAASEMAPVTWPEFANIHPFAPSIQTMGYTQMLQQLSDWLAEITGFDAVSFQPNSGAQGEYAGLLAIRRHQEAQGQGHRDVCLIPSSAHGTNPASAQMMGMRIVVVACDDQGNIAMSDLAEKLALHAGNVSAMMVTYPSTHGVFEAAIVQACELVHAAGGQVYMDGANLNAQAGLTKPGLIGADVCHMNLHKTFCIPHGGGGPGMGPIAVAKHLANYLTNNPYAESDSKNSVSAAPVGSALITTISWMYIRMMGASGIRNATEVAILNANYIARRLQGSFEVLYRGENGCVAHECILDLRNFKTEYGVTAEDVAKRLMDYGFHAPTLSFPVTDTLMVEPTESESKPELDRFCDAMLAIYAELQKIKSGEFDALDNPLKCAPHTAQEVAGEWLHQYSRETAVYPLPYVRGAKFWPSVKRIDNVAGDRNLVCTCPPISAYES